MTVTQEISLDLARENAFKTIIAKQYDQGSRLLKVTILNQGEPMVVDSGSSVYLNVKRPDGQGATYDGTTDAKIEVQSDGTILVPLTSWMLNVAGKVVADLTIASGSSQLSTLNFTILVESSPNNSNPQEDERRDTLDNFILRIEDSINGCVKKSGDTITGDLNVKGVLTLPNSPTTPDEHTVSNAYISRVTANGEREVVDGSLTEISEIKGSTVRSTNLWNVGKFSATNVYSSSSSAKPSLTNDYGTTISNTEPSQSLTITQTSAPNTSNPHHYQNGYIAITNVNKVDATKKYVVSFDVKITNNPLNVSSMQIWTDNDTNSLVSAPIVNGRCRALTMFKGNLDGFNHIEIRLGGCSCVLSNFSIVEATAITDENVRYVPYFSDLKRAFIKAIKSTGRNLLDKNDKDIKDGWFINGVPNGSTEYNQKCSGWIAVEPNTTYIQNFTNVNNQYAFYDKNKNWISTAAYSDLSGENRISTFTTTANTYFVRIMYFQDEADVTYLMLGTEEQAYEPYTEDIYELPETLELAEYDSFNPQAGELTKQTRRLVIDEDNFKLTSVQDMNTYWLGVSYLSNYNGETQNQVIANNGFYTGSFNSSKSKGVYLTNTGNTHIAVWFNKTLFTDADVSTVAGANAYLKSLADANIPLTVDYKLATPTITKIPNVQTGYTVYNNGSETVINDNDIYGAIPTITQTYSIHENPTEAANKAYVNNGLAKKLDKTGGTITGNLIVEGKTDTELGAIVSRKSNTTYGLTYDGDAYKLGKGSIDNQGNFTFDSNEGLPIALRDDSTTFADGELVMWSAEGNKFVSTGVTKEEFDLAKLEAEGWVTELVISNAGVTHCCVTTYLYGEVDDGTNPILAIKVNNELAEPIREIFKQGNDSTGYDYLLENLPVGTSIKIYHNPNIVDKCELYLWATNDYEDGYEGEYPRLAIYKCVKRILKISCDIDIICYSLPNDVRDICFASCFDITAHVPHNVRYAEIVPALVETDEVDESGDYIWKERDLAVHLDGLPEELIVYGDTETFPDLHVKAYVPYHLLEEAKSKFPDVAEYIDALVPASKVSEVGGGKLYRHTMYFEFVDTANLNEFVEEGDEPASFYVNLSFMSPKKYLLEGDYKNNDLNNTSDDYVCKVSDLLVFNGNITSHLGEGMSASVTVSSEEDFFSAVIREFGYDYILFDLRDGRFFQILLTEDSEEPMTCSITDYVAEL